MPNYENDHESYGNDPRGGYRPAEEGPTFPPSVQRRIDQAQSLLRQERPSEALSEYQQAGMELARANPELFALMVAGQFGVRSITFEQTERVARSVRTDRYAFGYRWGHDDTFTEDETTMRRSIRLG